MKIQGANILITGGARRIGRACAMALASRGANILLHYCHSVKDAVSACKQIDQLGVRVRAFQADLKSVAQIRALVKKAWATFGSIDVLVNSASVFLRTPMDTLGEREWDEILDTNLKGTFFLAREAGLRMAKRGKGKIINIADWSSERPYKNYLPYCISKAGVIAMTRGLARVFAPRIHVNAISPGPVLLRENISSGDEEAIVRGTPLKRIGSPEDIANTVLFLIEGTDFMTGSVVTVDGGRELGT